ncbi:MAG: nucleoside deaminase [Thermodesulfobacteriota bacterium]
MTDHVGQDHEGFMEMALVRAEHALAAGEFPVGCVLMAGGRLLCDGSREGTANGRANETEHAEIVALRRLEEIEAAGKGPERSSITCYCTLEPCLMCFGALLINGITNLVYAYEDAMGGGTSADLSRLPPLYSARPVRITAGVLRERSLALFKRFWGDSGNTYLTGTMLYAYTLGQP